MYRKKLWLRKTYAARKFQAVWRQTLARDRYIVVKDGMILLQAVVRGRRDRKYIRGLNAAAAHIQATYKMFEIRDAVRGGAAHGSLPAEFDCYTTSFVNVIALLLPGLLCIGVSALSALSVSVSVRVHTFV